jgi:glycerophosphoryl diester phosphodiesterase
VESRCRLTASGDAARSLRLFAFGGGGTFRLVIHATLLPNRRVAFLLGSLIAMQTVACLAAESPTPAERLLKTPRPLVIGHRGFSQFAPENTLPSFKFATLASADLVELDYHHSKDGALIVIHDYDLDRTTDAVAKWGGKKIRVDSKTAAELQTLDAGKWLNPMFAGTRLPLLPEALDFIAKGGGVTLIERKAGEAAACVKLLRDKGMVNLVVVQSFDWTYLSDFHAQCPEQVLGALGPAGTRNGQKLTDAEKELSPAWIDEARKAGASVVGWNKLVTRAAVEYAHQQGLKVWVYTINEAPLASTMLDMGVDGIITDNTAVIWRALALRQAGASQATAR